MCQLEESLRLLPGGGDRGEEVHPAALSAVTIVLLGFFEAGGRCDTPFDPDILRQPRSLHRLAIHGPLEIHEAPLEDLYNAWIEAPSPLRQHVGHPLPHRHTPPVLPPRPHPTQRIPTAHN